MRRTAGKRERARERNRGTHTHTEEVREGRREYDKRGNYPPFNLF